MSRRLLTLVWWGFLPERFCSRTVPECVIGRDEKEYGGQRRFLCHHCLHLGDFLAECGLCQERIEEFQFNTKGAFNAACLACEEIIFPAKFMASCDKCKQPSDPAIYHHRRVRILAVLSNTDFVTLRTLSGEQVKISEDGTEFFCRDEDETLQYVLNLENAGSEHKSENYRPCLATCSADLD